MKIAKDELYKWLQDACDIYLLQRLPRFSRSLAKQETALAKYYVIDNGIRNAVIPMQSDDDGKQLENTVYLELLRRRRGNETLSFWQDRGGCDFVVSEGEHARRLVQVTWKMNNDSQAGRKTCKREIDGLVAAAESLECEDLTIVTYDEESSIKERGHDIRVVPAWKWCLAEAAVGTLVK
jgi:predicted AAA+ superfamily ATPase